MRRLVARCVCGAVSQVPHGPVQIPTVSGEDPEIIENPVGKCCQCGKALNRANAWWHDLKESPEPVAELDLLSVD